MAGPKASVTSAPSAPTWPTPGAVGGRCQQLFGGGSQGLRTGPCSGPWGRASLGNHVLRRAGPPPGPPVCVFALLPERPETSVLSKPRFRQFILDPETALHVKRRRKAGAGGRACPMPRTRAGWSLPSPRVPPLPRLEPEPPSHVLRGTHAPGEAPRQDAGSGAHSPQEGRASEEDPSPGPG